jgi:hypothetical protein
MNEQVIIVLASSPILIAAGAWVVLLRLGRLRIRLMALTSGIAVFLGATIISFAYDAIAPDLFGRIVISSLAGSSFLLWWPILGRALKRHTSIRW